MNKVLGNKLKFNINKYTLTFIVLNLLAMIGVNSVLYILSNFITIDILKTTACILISYIALLFIFFIITIKDDRFEKLKLKEEKVNSLVSHLKYSDKLAYFISKKSSFFKEGINLLIDDIYYPYYYGQLLTHCEYKYISDYSLYLSEIREGNEFWIVLSDILFNKKSDNYGNNKIYLFINIDNNLYNHKSKVLRDLQELYELNQKYILRNKFSNSYNEDIINKEELDRVKKIITILEKAINLNDKLYNIDKYIPHKEMINILFDNWMVLIVNYIVDTESLLNDELINAFDEVYDMADKVITEHENEKEIIIQKEKNEIINIWNEQCRDYLNLIESISKNFK